MARVGVVLGLLLVVAGIGVGVWQHADPEGAAEYTEQLQDQIVWGPIHDSQAPYFSHTFEVRPVAKTAIDDEWGCSFDIEFMSPAADAVSGDTHLDVWGFLSGLVSVELHYIQTFQDAGVWYNRFSVLAIVGGFGEIGDYATFVVPADGSIQTVSASLTVGAELRSTTGANPIGADKANVTHAKEQTVEDAWHIPTGQYGYASIGTVTNSLELTEDIHPDTQVFTWQANFCFPEATGDVLRIANISFNGAGIDASELGPTALEPGVGTGDGEVWVEGSGSTVRYYFEDETSASFGVGEASQAARVYSFSGLSIEDMDGNAITTLLVHCPAVQIYDTAEEEWQHVCQTVAEWNAATYTDTWGYYSWDAGTPPDGAVRLLADVSLYIDAESGRAHKLDGFAGVDTT